MNRVIQDGWQTIRFHDGMATHKDETIAVEYPLTIFINGDEFATMVCSPINLRELIIGFLASEGLIRFYDDIQSMDIDTERGFAYVQLYKTFDKNEKDHSKRFIGSCCGKSRQFYLKNDVQTAKTVMSKITISEQNCLNLMGQLQQKSTYFQQTGGVHNAALCTVDQLLESRTDIGRHNALDKIYGYILKNNIQLTDKLITFSGRISSEVLLKVSKIGIGIIISKAAPTDLALRLASDLGITVIGFARRNKMNVYTHHDRVIEAFNSANEVIHP